jgi:hypothetical protein
VHPDGVEHVVRRAQLLARIEAAAITAQPLPVEEMRTGEVRTELSAAQPVDRLAIEVVGGGAVAQQRPAASLDAEATSLPQGCVVSASRSSSSRT